VNSPALLKALAFSLLLASLASPVRARTVDGVVAVVNDEPITFSEFRESVAESLGIPEGDADIHSGRRRTGTAFLRDSSR